MRVPSLATIINRALDMRGDAAQAHDALAIRHIDKLIKNLYTGQKQRWDADGVLIVRSANDLGAIYRTTQHACSCPAFVALCVHRRLYDLLIDMQQTDADMAADPPTFDDPLPSDAPGDNDSVPGDERPRHLGARIAAARRNVAYAM